MHFFRNDNAENKRPAGILVDVEAVVQKALMAMHLCDCPAPAPQLAAPSRLRRGR